MVALPATDAEAGQDTTADDETQAALPVGAQHHAGAEDEDGGEDEEGLAPAEEVAGDVGEETAEEGASLVDADEVGLEQRQIRRVVLCEFELLLERRQGKGRAEEGCPGRRRVSSRNLSGFPPLARVGGRTRVVANGARGKRRNSGARIEPPAVDGRGRRPVLLKGENPHGEDFSS